MANDNNIPGFSAADIEKYHRGQLSNAERNALEKAALDDPFLADALEGYALPGTDVQADIQLLKQKLSSRIEEDATAKIIPIGNGTTRKFPWLRAAVAILVIGGAGLLANQFFFNKKSGDIAQADKNVPVPATVNDSVAPAEKNNNGTADIKNTPATGGATTTGSIKEEIIENKLTTTDNAAVKDVTPSTGIETRRKDELAVTNLPAPVASGAAKPAEEKKELANNAGNDKGDIAKISDDKNPGVVAGTIPAPAKAKAATDADGVKDQAEKATAMNRKAEDQHMRYQQNNIFRGRVTDGRNAGVPFANVTNIEDKAGTYTDVNGYFNLTSPDSVLNVQVRSVGFENNQVQLKNTVASTKIVLHEDRSLSEVVISNQKPNVAARNRDANRTLQEPEPADGWDNYDTYLSNNLDIPEDIKTKQAGTGSVQVSFEVDKYGEPVNIRIEKSLCDKCDKEAIRLIKDGPKWKRNAATKGRTTVTINF